MAFKYTLAKANKMGDYSSQYGQQYWGEGDEQGALPIMFNSQNQNIVDGAVITAEERVERTSKKSGNLYHFLKKVRVLSGADAPASNMQPSSSSDSSSDSDSSSSNVREDSEILTELKLQTALLRKLAGEAEPKAEPTEDVLPEANEILEGEPVDLSDIPI